MPRVFLIVALVALALSSTARAQATGELEGVVLERATERPMAGVRVAVTAAARIAVTDDNGRFFFAGLPAGRQTLELSAANLEPITVEENIAPGTRRSVRYEVSPRREEPAYQSTVRAPRLVRAEAVETRLTAEAARRIPGTGDDPLKVVEDLPGVARATVGTGQLIVWGAAPADTRVLIDGVDVPALYHVGGWRSILNSDLVGEVALAPGGFGAAYGRALGGLVRVTTATPGGSGVHGDVGADLLDASALIHFTLGKRLTITVAGRYSWLDKLAQALVSPEAAAFVPLPRYDDYQLQATLRLRQYEQLSLLFLGADDSLRQSVFAGDPAQAHTHDFDRTVERVILHYSAERDGGAIDVTPSFGYDSSGSVDRFGAAPASLKARALSAALRAQYGRHVAAWATLAVGLDLIDTHADITRVGSLTIPPREGDPYVFGQPPGDDVAAADEKFHVLDAAPFVSAELRAGPVTISPGARFEALLLEGDHIVPPVGNAPVSGFSRLVWNVDPRLAVSWRAHPRLTLTAATGIYHQPPDLADLSARFGATTLGPARAIEATLGLQARILSSLSGELVGFYRQLDGLAARSPNSSPPAGQALTQDGSGRSYGGQLLVRLAPWRNWFGWISYTLSRSERQDHAGAAMRLSDFDQTHVLAVVAGWERRRWQLGARLRYTSGFPRTPVVGAFYDARDDRFEPLFGAVDTTRLPDFVQLDLRVERAFSWARASLRLYLDVQNVTWQRNAEEVAYSESFQRRSYITGLPTLAVLGARVRF